MENGIVLIPYHFISTCFYEEMKYDFEEYFLNEVKPVNKYYVWSDKTMTEQEPTIGQQVILDTT